MAKTFAHAAKYTPNRAKTHNMGETWDKSGDPNVDLFFLIGAARNTDIIPTFEKALAYDQERTIRTLLWARDVRQGAGERQTFRRILRHMETHYQDDLIAILPHVPEYGRWDDVLIFESGRVKNVVAEMVHWALLSGDNLCAKWMPRKGRVAADLRQRIDMTPKQYRKMLVNLTNVVENKMCAQQWPEIQFDKLPSIASARYKNAFRRHVPEEYQKYVDALKSGEKKINASAIFPHDVLKELDLGSIFHIGETTNADVINAQWKALPNYVGDSKLLPICDVSGSMTCNFTNGNTRPIDVSVALGLYLSEKNTGPFNGLVMTFSANPKLLHLTGDVVSRAKQLERAEWQMNTNLEAAYTKVLNTAVKNNVSQADMPEYLVILSDMEFDRCVRRRDKTAFEDMRQRFAAQGYELPNIVFWNLNGRPGNLPVTINESGVCLISGFSPSIMKSVLAGERLTPKSIMDDTIMTERYNIFPT